MLHARALAALMLVLSGMVSAREPQAPPPAAVPTPDPVTADPAEILKFLEYEQRMSVPVRLNGAGPFRFVIDTGSERTVISRQVATSLGLLPGPIVNIAAMTGVSPVQTVRIPSIEIDAVAPTIAIEAPQLEEAHLGADGLIGLDSLADNSLLIDFDKSEMHVQRASRRSLSRAPDEIVITAKSVMGRLIVTDARYAGRRISVVLDTGTSVSVGNMAFLKLVQKNARLGEPVRMMSVTGAMMQAEYRVIPRMTLGGIEISTLPVAFSDVPPFRRLRLDDRPALFLGMDAMRMFRQVRIDFANREVRFLLPRKVLRPSMGLMASR